MLHMFPGNPVPAPNGKPLSKHACAPRRVFSRRKRNRLLDALIPWERARLEESESDMEVCQEVPRLYFADSRG